jgi:hypothetical protein
MSALLKFYERVCVSAVQFWSRSAASLCASRDSVDKFRQKLKADG